LAKQYSFNTATVYAIDAATNAPTELMSVSDISLEFSRDVKELQGRKAFADISALGKGKCSGKGTINTYNAEAINLFLGNMGGITAGQRLFIQEPFTLATGTPNYTVANAVNFYKNLGVKDVSVATNVNQMAMVASAPTAGQYALDGTTKGKYLFSTDDATAGKSCIASYIYTATTGGSIIALNNPDMDIANYFAMFLQGGLVNKQGVKKQTNVWLNCCLSSKLGLGWKLGEFNSPSFDFTASADDLDSLGWMSIGN
jgi:hypothetical protein